MTSHVKVVRLALIIVTVKLIKNIKVNSLVLVFHKLV